MIKHMSAHYDCRSLLLRQMVGLQKFQELNGYWMEMKATTNMNQHPKS